MSEKCREMKLDVNIKFYGTAMLTDTTKVFLQEANLYICNEEKLHSTYQKYQTSAVHGEKSN